MKDEIKEILDNLRKTADNSVFVVCSTQEELDKIPKYTANFLSINDSQAKLLLDYITNLQEENEWKDYLERIINSQTKKYKEVLDKIKERVNKVDFEMGDFPELKLAGDILELLEEIDSETRK